MIQKLFKRSFNFSISGVTALLIVISFSCNSSEKSAHQKRLLNLNSRDAIFDYFYYKGEDSFYENYPLPGDDYFYNPILPGWYSDPSICTNGEDYFLVTSTFSYFPGVPIFHSKDLVNWQQIGHVLDRPSQLDLANQRVSEGIFAPAISYNPHNKTYYLITTNIRKGNFFVKTKDPFGHWSDPIWLPDVHGIDPSFFFDDDGKAYIVNNDAPDGEPLYDGHRVIRIHEFDVEKEMTTGKSKILVNGGVNIEDKPVWIEGPHLYKINGEYFLMCAEGGTSVNHSEVIFKSQSPMGDYIPWDKNPILTQRHLDPERELPITCAGHADLIEDKDGRWWAVFLACRPIDGQFENLGRETFLMPVKWSDDGFPYMTKGNELIPRVLKKEGVTRADNVTFGNFEIYDDFDTTKLDYQWMTLRGPADNLISLKENPGFLTLRFSKISASQKNTPAFVCRRIQHHKFRCSTKLYFNSKDSNDASGLLLFKDESHQYFLSVRKKGKKLRIALEKITSDEPETLAASLLDVKNKPIVLEVVSHGKLWDFYYTIEGMERELLISGVDAYYLSTANSFGFTGTTIGMYAVRNIGQPM